MSLIKDPWLQSERMRRSLRCKKYKKVKPVNAQTDLSSIKEFFCEMCTVQTILRLSFFVGLREGGLRWHWLWLWPPPPPFLAAR